MSDHTWLKSGTGSPPTEAWSFATDGRLAGFDQSRERAETLVADDAGGLYLLDRTGRVTAVSRGFHEPSRAVWSDDDVGAVVVERTALGFIDRKLKPAWEIDLADEILAVAIAPFGNHVAASLANGTTVIHDRTARRIARFTTLRPLHHLAFVVSEPHLVGASEYGLLGRWQLDGEPVWAEHVLANIGDLAVTGDGSRTAVAAFNRGVQLFRGRGRPAGSLAVEGTPERVSLSYAADAVAATTVEGHVYWMNLDGVLRWGAALPEAAARIVTAPLGNGLAIAFDSGRIVQLRWGRSG